jgi:twitching motility protein PilT
MDVKEVFKLMVEAGASDLHIKAGTPPGLRIDGTLAPADVPPLTTEDMANIASALVPDRVRKDFENNIEVDFAFSIKDVGRFRVNAFSQQGQVGMAIRRVTVKELDIEKLGLPPVIKTLAEESRGLVLVTGTAGSGKTTTLGAMINHVNSTRHGHIVTVEDPIEILHRDKMCMINQREIGIDTRDFADALKNVVRQDPDIILIGEMRDHETVQAALTAAEMGNLVLSTLHTIDSAETIFRIIDFFPPHQQHQIQLMLASTLRGIISMRLLPKVGGGLVAASEVLVATATVRELINENKISKLKEVIEQGEYYGMQSFDQSLISLYQSGQITMEHAVAMAANAHDFKLKIRKLGIVESVAESAY